MEHQIKLEQSVLEATYIHLQNSQNHLLLRRRGEAEMPGRWRLSQSDLCVSRHDAKF